MPMYTYKCPKCEKKEEHFIRSSDPTPECTKCEVIMEKIITGSLIRPSNASNLPCGKRYT